MSKPSARERPLNLLELLKPGQAWVTDDGHEVVIDAIDEPPYPILFHWLDNNETVGRDSVESFFRDFVPSDLPGFLTAALAARDASHEAEIARLREELATIRDDWGEGWGCVNGDQCACCCCDATAPAPADIQHGDDCPVGVATRALAPQDGAK